MNTVYYIELCRERSSFYGKTLRAQSEGEAIAKALAMWGEDLLMIYVEDKKDELRTVWEKSEGKEK